VIQVDLLAASESEEWDAFLRSTPGGLIYYSIAYRDLLVDVLGCDAEYLVAREGGEIRGVLPIMWASDREGRVCNSLPFYGSHGGPVALDRPAERALIDAWYERATDPGTLAANVVANPFLEHDPPSPVHDLIDERIGQVTTLPAADPNALMSLYSKNGRRAVRRAERHEVEVRRDPDSLLDLWRLHTDNIRAIGGLAKPERFFTKLPRHLESGEGFDLWIAAKDGGMIAGLLVLYFNDIVEYWTPAVDAAYRAEDPMALILFQAMLDAARRGCRLWNWGGTWTSQEGVYRFKRKWGAEDRPYRYFVHVNDRSILEATPEELLERFPYFYVVPFSALRSGARAR
jgi:Acetyltransferase (GNAT) domain